MFRKRLKHFLLVLICISFFITTPLYAFRFNIDKPKILLNLKPGRKYTDFITLDSYGYREDLGIRVYVSDIIYLPDGSNGFLPPGSTKWSLSEWINVEPKQFILKGNTSQRVKYEIMIPESAEGGRYGVVFFEVFQPDISGLTRANQRAIVRIGSVIGVDVIGTEKYKAVLLKLKAEFDRDDNLIASCIIRNEGNLLIRPLGDFVVMDRDGNEFARKTINPKKGGVLPDTSRIFKVTWEKEKLPFKDNTDYILQVTFDYGGDSLLGGQTYFMYREKR